MKEKRKNLSLKGCFPPIPTPFGEGGKVDTKKLSHNIEKWQKTPLAGIVVLGSNGEAPLLNTEEKIAIFRSAGETMMPDRHFIAGTGCESSIETLYLTEKAAGFGAVAALVVTPHYYKPRMDHSAFMKHYSFIADNSPIPIILYNVPGFTGIDFYPETVIALSRHPNIIGIKESAGNLQKIGRLIQHSDDSFQVLAGSGDFFLPALAMGAVGGVMALAAIAPYELNEIQLSFNQGKLEEARQIQLRLIEANRAVTVRFGIPGLKAALDIIHMYGGPVRSPLREVDANERCEIEKILVEAGLNKSESWP